MENENIEPMVRDFFNQIKTEIPHLSHIEIHYYGSSDSFDDFNSFEAYDKSGNYFEFGYDFCSRHIEVLYTLVEKVGADFNNDGAEGTISIDLLTGRITVDNFSIYCQSIADGSFEINVSES